MLADDYYENNNYGECEVSLIRAKKAFLKQENFKKYGMELELIVRKLLSICCLSQFDLKNLVGILKEYMTLSEEYWKGSDHFMKNLQEMINFIECMNLKTISLPMVVTMTLPFKNYISDHHLRSYEQIHQNPDIFTRIEFCKWNGFMNLLIGEFQACETALKKIIEYCEEFYGKKHILVANYYQRLGSFIWRIEKNIDKAEQFLNISLKLKQCISQGNEKELGDLYFEYAEFLKYGKNNETEAEKY